MLSNWHRLLHSFIESRRLTPFAWGTNDCCTFAADAMLAITGSDPMDDHRGYHTAKEALLIMGSNGLFLFADDVLTGKGYLPIALPFATLGDVVGVILRDRETLAVHLGNTIAAPGKDGVVFIRPTEVVKAWRAE
jgi:hypothetical protein